MMGVSKSGNNNLTEAFKDNLVLECRSVEVSSFSTEQKDQLLLLIELYVDNTDEGHGRIRTEEVKQYLDDTWFSWIGSSEDDAVYYYRIHSPVILIEFDHQKPVPRNSYTEMILIGSISTPLYVRRMATTTAKTSSSNTMKSPP